MLEEREEGMINAVGKLKVFEGLELVSNITEKELLIGMKWSGVL